MQCELIDLISSISKISRDETFQIQEDSKILVDEQLFRELDQSLENSKKIGRASCRERV